MTDAQKAQKVLEGRCLVCDALLPEHARDCVKHRHYETMRKFEKVVQTLATMRNTLDTEDKE